MVVAGLAALPVLMTHDPLSAWLPLCDQVLLECFEFVLLPETGTYVLELKCEFKESSEVRSNVWDGLVVYGWNALPWDCEAVFLEELSQIKPGNVYCVSLFRLCFDQPLCHQHGFCFPNIPNVPSCNVVALLPPVCVLWLVETCPDLNMWLL